MYRYLPFRDFSDPFGIESGTCPFEKNSDILLQIGNFHLTHYYLALILICTCILLQLISSFLAYLEVVRAGRIHTIYAFDFLAIFIKIHFLIWEISFSDWDFFHQNWEKSILFGIGNKSFYGTRIYRQKNPAFSILLSQMIHCMWKSQSISFISKEHFQYFYL